jgi:hypothetical protein
VIGRDPENFSGRDLEIFLKIYQDIQLDESNLKFSIGSRPTFGSRPKKFQPGRLIPVATVFGSRSDIFFGSRPGKNLGRGLDRIEVPNTRGYLLAIITPEDYKRSRSWNFFLKYNLINNSWLILFLI